MLIWLSKVWALLACVAACVALNGCGSDVFYAVPPCATCGVTPPFAGAAFLVHVMAGGQPGGQPVRGAAVAVYAAGTTGNGSSPELLLSAALMTDAAGNVSVPAGYSCALAGSLLYVVAQGGAVGSAGANGNAVLMTAAGACSAVPATVTVNEATTVAAAYGLAAFYAAPAASTNAGFGTIGASATNLTGLTNAFMTAATLADPATGAVPGAALAANVTVPVARVNSVASALHGCVAAAAGCAGLYGATTVGGRTPGNTLDAAFAVGRNPLANVAGLFSVAKAGTGFAPVLTAVPADWAMYLVITGGGMDSPSRLALDSTGAVWVANFLGGASKFTAAGAAVFASGITGSGLNNSYGIAVDLKDNAWITNEQPVGAQGTGSVSVLSATGSSLAGTTGYTAGGMNFPLSVAIDPDGTAWVLQFGDSHVTLLNSSGVPLSGASGYTTSLFMFPVAIAIDGNHFGWVVNEASDQLTKVAPDGSSFTNYTCCHLASGIAIDQGNNLWVSDYYADAVSLMTNAGTVIGSNYTGAGSMYHPQGIAVDGGGTVWVANYRTPYLTVLAGAGTAVPGASLVPATGLGGDAGQLTPFALAIDASGNVWVSNQGSDSVTKYVGLAVPVATPLSGLPRVP